MFEDDFLLEEKDERKVPAAQTEVVAPKFDEIIDLAFMGDIHNHDEEMVMGTAWVTPFTIRTTKPVQSDANSKCYVNYETGG